MLCHRGFAVAITIMISGSISYGTSSEKAWAQSCDERYPWTCRGYGAPPIMEALPPRAPYWQREPFQPRDPFASREIAPDPYQNAPAAPMRPREFARPVDPAIRSQYAALYAPINGEPFPIPAVNLSQIDPEYLRKSVLYPTDEQPGTIIIDAQNRFLYFIQDGRRALRYGVGVGRQGFGWSGVATIHDKREWPDWYPPKEMLARQPELRRQMSELPSGIGMAGGPRNPLGSRAMYLWQGNKDTLYRIHGTVEPWTIGQSVSSGCIRMINQDVIDLYERAPVGGKVVVLPSRMM